MPSREPPSARIRRRAWAWVRAEWAKEAAAAIIGGVAAGIVGHNLGSTLLAVGIGLLALGLCFFLFAWYRAAIAETTEADARTDEAVALAEDRRKEANQAHNAHEETKAAYADLGEDRNRWRKNSGMLEENFERVGRMLNDEKVKVVEVEKERDGLAAQLRSRLSMAKERLNAHALRIAKLVRATATNDSEATLAYLERVVEDVRTVLGDFEADEIVQPMTKKVAFMQGTADGEPFVSVMTRDLKPLTDWLRMKAKDLKDADLRPGFAELPPLT